MPCNNVTSKEIEAGAQAVMRHTDIMNWLEAVHLSHAVLTAALAGHVDDWREITEDDEPPRDVELLLGWWRTWPERKWESPAGLYGSTRGGWIHGQATHWQPLPAAPAQREAPHTKDAGDE